MVHRRLVREIEVALERFVDDARAGAAVAVVQVDDRAVEREGLLDLAPVVFVFGHVGRGAAGRARGGRGEAGLRVVGERGDGRRTGGASTLEKRAASEHAGRIPYLTVPNGDRMAR